MWKRRRAALVALALAFIMATFACPAKKEEIATGQTQPANQPIAQPLVQPETQPEAEEKPEATTETPPVAETETAAPPVAETAPEPPSAEPRTGGFDALLKIFKPATTEAPPVAETETAAPPVAETAPETAPEPPSAGPWTDGFDALLKIFKPATTEAPPVAEAETAAPPIAETAPAPAPPSAEPRTGGFDALLKMFKKDDPAVDIAKANKAREIGLRIDRLEILLEILNKDNPPHNETFAFRQNIVKAQKAHESGAAAEAERFLAEAEAWVAEARKSFYREHESKVAAGATDQYLAALLDQVGKFSAKGKKAAVAGDDWAAEQYYVAAIEQAELTLLIMQQSPDQADELIVVAMMMEDIHKNAYGPERAAEVRARMHKYIDRSMMELDRYIKDCASSRIHECTRTAVATDREYLKQLNVKMKEKNDTLSRLTMDAAVYNSTRYQRVDHEEMIQAWHTNWLAYLAKAPKQDDKVKNIREKKEYQKKLQEHSKRAQGASPAYQAKIDIVEAGAVTRGDVVMIKGKICNRKQQAILNPRVTIYGGIMSEVLDLGYRRLEPQVIVDFKVILKGYATRDHEINDGKPPAHSILLIYNDVDGREIKVQQTIK